MFRKSTFLSFCQIGGLKYDAGMSVNKNSRVTKSRDVFTKGRECRRTSGEGKFVYESLSKVDLHMALVVVAAFGPRENWFIRFF